MSRLFTYTVPFDDGAAPNPFNGLCTLAICKPAIRRVAKVGDWVAGFGSKFAPSGDLSGRLVYAMRLTEVVTMAEYDRLASTRWPYRIPDRHSAALQDRLGDCIYDYSNGSPPQQRPGVHGPENAPTDLSGENVLISDDFYYFGNRAIPLSDELRPILHQTQGHKSTCNSIYFEAFTSWLRSAVSESGQIHGWPDSVVRWNEADRCGGCKIRKVDDSNDGECQ